MPFKKTAILSIVITTVALGAAPAFGASEREDRADDIYAALERESQDIEHGLTDTGIAPVQVRLLL